MIPEQWCSSFQHQLFISWIIEPTLSVDKRKNTLKAPTPNYFLGYLTREQDSWFWSGFILIVFALQQRYC